MSKSALLTVIIEPDLEMSDDGSVWNVVRACEGHPPRIFGAGYLHRPGCSCRMSGGKLCDVGWLEEFVRQAGAESLLEGAREQLQGRLSRIRARGRMVSEVFESQEGKDYDEYFELQDVEVMG